MESATLARPKAKKAVAKNAVPKSAVVRPTVMTIKGSLEWRSWVERGAEFCRTDVAKLVDAALVAYLQSRGFTEEAPRR